MLALTYLFNDPLVVFLTGMALMILFFWYFATDIERRKRNVGSVLLLGVCALSILACIPLHERLKGSIDIIGGSAFTLRVQPRETEDGEKLPITAQQIDQAIVVIEKRLNALGTAEPMIAKLGDDKIEVQMPGVETEESERIRTILEKVAKLELREVSPRSEEPGADGKTLAQRVQEGLEIVPGFRAYTVKDKDEDGNETKQAILLTRRVALGGNDVANAVPSPMRADAAAVTLTNAGANKMAALTSKMQIGVDRIAVVLDGEVINAPVVQDRLYKNFEVSGLQEPGEVQTLCNALMNPLENALEIDEFRNVSPTLGKAVVQQGVWAGVIGLAITFLFILIYYRMAGIIALVGLLVNTVMLFGAMAMFGFVFSLPGIAGMILTIGMAVDANVLIYERLREEIAAGKSLKNAISVSYEKAFTAIFDSNFTSLITAIVLFWLGSSSIKGFAITLTIGIVASMFAAILVTRVLFRWGTDLELLKKLSFMELIKPTRFDFLGKGKACVLASLVLILVCVGYAFVRGEKAFGVDFTGGTLIKYQLGKEVQIPLADVEKALGELTELEKKPIPQEQSNPATGTLLTIRCDTRDSQEIDSKLRQAIPELAKAAEKPHEDGSPNYLIDGSKEEVSALIGGSFLKTSVIALVVGLIGILIYITVRFEFSFALGGFVALLHDVVISIGLVILLGGELSLIHVGAILTIAGYSINDTIVIFDRIRENLLIRQGSIRGIMNEAINATLSRTVLTSSTTILTVTILSFFGGSNLRDFSIMILIGLVVGTYSSVFIASPIVMWWSRRKGGDLRSDVVATEVKAEAVAAAP